MQKFLATGLLAGLVILLACYPGFAAGEDFYFVQITDTHLGIPENEARTKKIVAAVNALPISLACVVHTGDICDRKIRKKPGACARAAEVFNTLKAPVYFLAGNNDIDLFSGAGRSDYTNTFSPLTYSKKIRGVLFVFAYTDPLREGEQISGFDAFHAVAGELKKAGDDPVLLFHHGPCVRDFYANAYHPGWEAREKWVNLLNAYPVKAVVAGHFHRDEFHWLGEVPLYVAGPVAEKYGRQAGFRIYEYKAGRLSYTAQYLE